MAITTALDLISLALRTCNAEGIGQTPDNQDVTDAFNILNGLIGQWAKERYLVYNLIDLSVTSTGAQSYTVGPTGNIVTTRIDKLERAYVRLLPITNNNPLDTPLEIIEAHEDYAMIPLKKLVSYPCAIFLDSGYPNGTIYPYPVPTSGMYEIHIIVKNTAFDQFPSLTTQLEFPPEYLQAFWSNLSCLLRPLFGLPPEPSLVAIAKTSLNVIRGANVQIPRLSMPMGFGNIQGGFIPPWQAGLHP